MRENYNKKIFDLRDQKSNLIDYIKIKLEKLKETHLEISPKQRIIPNLEVTFNESREFPEKKFQLSTYLPHLNESLPVSAELIKENNEVEQVLSMQRDIFSISQDIADSKVDKDSKNLKQPPPTEWEREMKGTRMKRKLFEQNQIILKINERILRFDKQVEQLSQDRFQVEVDAKFLDLYILTINQELFVLKDFEQIENNMIKLVEKTMLEKNDMFQRIVKKKNQIDDFKRLVDKLKEDELDLQQKFATKCADNKFSDYFRKIFKKKYKAPKPPRDENDSEEESYSEASFDDNESAMSAEDSFKYLDQNVCPTGCDKNLYKLSFALRDERYELENQIEKNEKTIVQEQAKLEQLSDEYLDIDSRLKSGRDSLALFRVTFLLLEHFNMYNNLIFLAKQAKNFK